MSLRLLPDSFGEAFLPYAPARREKRQGRLFAAGRYFDNVKLCQSDVGNGEVAVAAKCFRSQRRNSPPHRLHLTVTAVSISDAYCSCKAGLVKCLCNIGLL